MKSNKIFEERTEVYGEMVVRSGVNHQMQGKRSGRIGKAACCVGLCLLMLLGINRYVPEQSYGEVTVSEEDIENLRQNLKEVEEAIDRQKEHLSEMNRDLSTMQMALTNYGALLKEYYKEIEEAQERKTALEEAIRKNVSDNALLTAEREELHKDYLRTLRALRENRDATTLELIFDSRSLEEFLSGLERAKDLSEYKQKLLEKMDEKFEKIDAEKAKLEQDLQDQNLRYEKLVELGRQAEEKIADTERDLTELAAEILETENRILELTETTEEVQKELTELIRERERQLEIERQKELERLEELERQKERERLARQTLLWPLEYPLNRRVTSPFGYRYHPISGTYKFHSGVDLAGPNSGDIFNNPVYAAMDGTVIACVVDRGTVSYGTYIVISHNANERYGGSISTLYAHLESVTVKEGDKVTQGQVIGRVGSTGASTGPHLHFEVRKNGVVTDPFGYEFILELNGTPVNIKEYVTGV